MASNMRLAELFLMVGAAGAALPVATNHASAQVARGEIAVRGGTGTDERGIHSSAVSITPSVLYAPDAWFSASVSGTATQFGTTARAYGGSAVLGTRVPLGSVAALAATASGSTIHTSFNATYASVDITPTLEATVDRLTVYAGAHALAGSSTVRIATSTPGGVLGSAASGTRDVSNSRTSIGPVVGAQVESQLAARASDAQLISIASTTDLGANVSGVLGGRSTGRAQGSAATTGSAGIAGSRASGAATVSGAVMGVLGNP